MKFLQTTDAGFRGEFEVLLRRGEMDVQSVAGVVGGILADIRARGLAAVREQVARFDGWDGGELRICPDDMARAWEATGAELRAALRTAYERICAYHEKEREKSWFSVGECGEVLGQKLTAVERAGVYVPGGKAAYPSSLLMNVAPAKVAGVDEIVVCTPAVGGQVNALLLAAMHLLGVREAYKVGGASAVGLMAYGARTVASAGGNFAGAGGAGCCGGAGGAGAANSNLTTNAAKSGANSNLAGTSAGANSCANSSADGANSLNSNLTNSCGNSAGASVNSSASEANSNLNATATATNAAPDFPVRKVDVITGPGNIYVATAKKLVFGDVGVDMVAGPSEVGIIADESASPRVVAVDLLSQAEHDEIASSFLVTPSLEFARAVEREIYAVLPTLPRERIARTSIDNRAAIIVAQGIDECVALMNELAVEHLEVATRAPWELLPRIRHAGAIFLGHHTSEAFGDYLAGPNHTLPTGATARFFSPLGVEHFMKKSSIISLNAEFVAKYAAACKALANAEFLQAHAMSVAVRESDGSGE